MRPTLPMLAGRITMPRVRKLPLAMAAAWSFPAVTAQAAALAAGALPPEGLLGCRFARHPDPQFCLPHCYGAPAGHQFDPFTGLQQQLQGPLGQGLARGTGHGQHQGIHGLSPRWG
jgi:hypothetical protein